MHNIRLAMFLVFMVFLFFTGCKTDNHLVLHDLEALSVEDLNDLLLQERAAIQNYEDIIRASSPEVVLPSQDDREYLYKNFLIRSLLEAKSERMTVELVSQGRYTWEHLQRVQDRASCEARDVSLHIVTNEASPAAETD